MIREHGLYDFGPFTFYWDLFHGLVHDLSRLPWWLSGKSPANAGDVVLISGLEDPLEEEIETHSSILAWRIPRQTIVHGVAKSRTSLSD